MSYLMVHDITQEIVATSCYSKQSLVTNSENA